jgi:hypothetical protein
MLSAGCVSPIAPGTDLLTDPPVDENENPVDCGAILPAPLAFSSLDGLFASEDFAFDSDGHLISHSGSQLFRQEYPPGAVTPFATTDGGPGGPASMRMLKTGDLVYANVDTSTLYRVSPNGGTEPLYGALGYAMGIDLHVSGMVFLSDLLGLLRIDPYEQDVEVLIDQGVLNYANGMSFSADFSRLYFGTRDGVFAVDVDVAGVPIGEPFLWGESDPGELLGMGVDACDNVYAIHGGRRLLRYSSDGGEPDVVLDAGPDAFMTNLQWGSGLGGWDALSIYITDRSLSTPGYYEVPVGVRSKGY